MQEERSFRAWWSIRSSFAFNSCRCTPNTHYKDAISRQSGQINGKQSLPVFPKPSAMFSPTIDGFHAAETSHQSNLSSRHFSWWIGPLTGDSIRKTVIKTRSCELAVGEDNGPTGRNQETLDLLWNAKLNIGGTTERMFHVSACITIKVCVSVLCLSFWGKART